MSKYFSVKSSKKRIFSEKFNNYLDNSKNIRTFAALFEKSTENIAEWSSW